MSEKNKKHMSGGSINRETYRGMMYSAMSSSGTCDDKRLQIPGGRCSNTVTGVSSVFGPAPSGSGIQEQVFTLVFDGQKKQMFKTARTDSKNGKTLIRYLNLEKENSNPVVQDASGLSGKLQPLKYFVEIWHKDTDGTLIPYTPNPKSGETLRRELGDVLSDPIRLPRELGAEFYIKVLAIGNPSRPRRVKMNAKFYVECRGSYDYVIEEDPLLDQTSVKAGETKVLANGRSS